MRECHTACIACQEIHDADEFEMVARNLFEEIRVSVDGFRGNINILYCSSRP